MRASFIVSYEHAVVLSCRVLIGRYDCCGCAGLSHPCISRDRSSAVGICSRHGSRARTASRMRETANKVIGRGSRYALYSLYSRSEGFLGFVEDNRQMRRPLVRLHFLEQLPQHVAKAINRIHVGAIGRARLEPDRMIGTENVAGAVDEKDVIAFFYRSRSRRGGRGFFRRNFGGLGSLRFCRSRHGPNVGRCTVFINPPSGRLWTYSTRSRLSRLDIGSAMETTSASAVIG